ncbi:MtnX-like HAD-IB family phosphatase [Paenibacillus sp. N3.4]|uniref:MtnX-like HAD-IB family phosphatase n=1 Tax=Paenibacillus sp. N3.4 TaxID=2603222 RepID=UPI0011CC69E1|nr:MtnX-like HAD-IB family phosphatase [Paenibacillus sp. N3.4]TXK75141.1 HAD-IB family phosphatase [Paenibacillus sp. N3.4]
MQKVVVVTDFDGTLMEQDVGDLIMDTLGVTEEPEVVEASRLFSEKKVGSSAWIKAAYPMLAGQKQQVDTILEGVHLRDGAREFIDFCKQKEVPITVLSDGMVYYIEQILSHQEVTVANIIGNPITYLANGDYQFGIQNSNEACSWCGCCKASVVKKLKEEGHLVIYIGDGSSDYYGSSFADWIFARSSLAAYLTKEGTAFHSFRTFHDILQVLLPAWDSYVEGTADRRLQGRFPALCKFST